MTVRGNVIMDSLDPLLDAAAAGLGLVQVDESAARALLADNRLQRVLVDFVADGPPIMLIANGRAADAACRICLWPIRRQPAQGAEAALEKSGLGRICRQSTASSPQALDW